MTTRTPEHKPRVRATAPRRDGNYILELTPGLGGAELKKSIGGKAFGLLRAMDAELKVPQAWVINTNAFDAMVESVITEVEDIEDLRRAILTAPLPAALQDEVESIFKDDVWAVRSSAVEEDGTRSFAGQQHSVLKVAGADNVILAIREVWASLFEAGALAYRARLAVDGLPQSMAVVIQRMLAPELAGVLFTQNPMTGATDEAVVSVAEGLGTAVVGGERTDTFFVERPSGYLRKHEARETGAEPLLRSSELELFAKICDRVDRLMSSGVDLEWALVNGELQVLQLREITTGEDPDEETVWSNSNVGEALPGVATPLTWSILKDFSVRGFEQAFGALGLQADPDVELVGSFYGRIFLNITEFVRIASAIPVMTPDALLSVAGGGGAEFVQDVAKESSARFVARLPQTLPRILATQISTPFFAPFWEAHFKARCEVFFEKDIYRLSQRALGTELDDLEKLFDRTGLVMLSVSSNFLLSYMLTTEYLKWFGVGVQIGSEKLLQGLSVSSAEPGKALLELGRIARRSMRLRRVMELPSEQIYPELQRLSKNKDVQHFLDELKQFQADFGHRAPREAELATPRWREDVRFVFDVLRGFIDSPHLPSPREVERDGERARAELEKLIRRGFLPGTREIFSLLLALTRANAERRESMRARVVDGLDMYRYFFLECGRRMTQMAMIRRPEDIFFLKIEEVRSWLSDINEGRDFRRRIIVRKAIYETFQKLPDPPSTFILRGERITPAYESAPQQEGAVMEMKGLAASPGRATGRARVVLSPIGASVEPGEILVVPYADVGWTPLFVAAAGVVMELGGPLSHASIVAREFRIPAVVNVQSPRATQAIKTGDLITVDGEQGLVFIHKPE